MPRPHLSSSCDDPNNIWWVRSWSSSLRNLLHFPVVSSFSGPNIFSNTICSNTLSLCFSLNVYPYKTRGKVTDHNSKINWNIKVLWDNKGYTLTDRLHNATSPRLHLQRVILLNMLLLTPWSRAPLEKLTGSAASQEIPRIFGTRRFLTVPTSSRHLSLSWANSIQSPPPPPTYRRSILILSSHLRLGLPN